MKVLVRRSFKMVMRTCLSFPRRYRRGSWRVAPRPYEGATSEPNLKKKEKRKKSKSSVGSWGNACAISSSLHYNYRRRCRHGCSAVRRRPHIRADQGFFHDPTTVNVDQHSKKLSSFSCNPPPFIANKPAASAKETHDFKMHVQHEARGIR